MTKKFRKNLIKNETVGSGIEYRKLTKLALGINVESWAYIGIKFGLKE